VRAQLGIHEEIVHATIEIHRRAEPAANNQGTHRAGKEVHGQLL
jgi:hypothetical protein